MWLLKQTNRTYKITEMNQKKICVFWLYSIYSAMKEVEMFYKYVGIMTGKSN